jgi:D-sedoheptulose 7-phosphate isomerase
MAGEPGEMEKVVFTNGCFDILHPGHIDLLTRARALGSKLIVGINSVRSVRAIKGVGRPVQGENERKAVLLALRSVDEVVIFDELTPENIIRNIKPNVIVKGGDWKVDEIVGADFVLENGGEVHSLSLKDGYSSSKVIDRLRSDTTKAQYATEIRSAINFSLDQHIDVLRAVSTECTDAISACAEIIAKSFAEGKKVLLCGNGGSAADAQHIAAEFVGRYETERKALPSVALTTDTSALTALANDYDFEHVFARQVEALAVPGDCLIAISTSGNSPNVISAVMMARKTGCSVVGLTGSEGKKLASLCDACVMVPSSRTSRIQEAHITIGHIWCEMVETRLAESSNRV